MTTADTGLFTLASSPSGNKVVYSCLKHFERTGKESHISVKYVVKGIEHYTLNGITHSVKDQQFLLVNEGEHCETVLQSKEQVYGICFFLATDTILDVYRNRCYDETFLLDNPFMFDSGKSFEVFQNIYSISENPLGGFLHSISKSIGTSGNFDFQDETIHYTVAEKVLESQFQIDQKIRAISGKKNSTKKELLRRVMSAKRMIDEHPAQDFDIRSLSAFVCLSEFHFFRTFKQSFGVSPHQYIITKRLERAKDLLTRAEHSITDIALLAGFSDIHSFSKSFTKAFKLPPSRFLQKQGFAHTMTGLEKFPACER